jgi:hypothetical protein
MVLRIVEETLKAVTPHILGVDPVDEFPSADPQASVDFLNDWFEMGIPEFRTATISCFLALNLYSLLRKGHLFPQLDSSVQAELLESLYGARGLPAYAFFYLLETPVLSAYYSRADVQRRLGFDVVALKEESEQRQVTRSGELPPKDGADDKSSAEGEGER